MCKVSGSGVEAVVVRQLATFQIEAMDAADEIEEREDNDGNSAFYNTRTQIWGWTREEVEENIEE